MNQNKMSIREFLKSRIFFKNLLISFGVTIILIFVTLILLRFYTHHGKSVQVPAFTGLTTEEAMAKARQYAFKVLISDSIYVDKADPGTVVDQVPEPGLKVKQYRTIFLTINAMTVEMVRIPSLTDISYRQALALLEKNGLKAGEIVYDYSEFKDLVLSAKYNGSDIRSGEKIPKGSHIDLVLGNGEGSAENDNNEPVDSLF
jgi:beta-lactam-binding protein with PASTA domain